MSLQESTARGLHSRAALPAGVVTLVFTDIEGSSAFSELHGKAFEPARAIHFRILRDGLQTHNGIEVHTAGDALLAVFVTPLDAVRWAIDVQKGLIGAPWPEEIGQVRVRIGMHTGEPVRGDRDYFGSVPNRAARICAAAHGNQILASEATVLLSRAEAARESVRFEALGVHRLKGVGEERLYQIVSEGLPANFPAPVTMGSLRHNLPLPATPFFGRESEVAALLGLIEAKKRLITVTGFGGMGKTRIALQTAELSAEAFPGGTWWCDLTEARDAEAMVQKMGFDLGLDMQPPPSARERVMSWLRDRKSVLLILDNLEQVSGVEAVLRDLASASSELVCLVTSRRRFGVQAESVFELPALPQDAASEFFAERATARSPSFAIDKENAEDVGKLCRSLGGVPLALELAAARCSMMTPRQMIARLGERFRLLQVRAPDLPERQRGLRAAIDWSYDLLDEDQKSTFAQLSVFSRSGFRLEDAEAVVDAFDAMEGLSFLCDHSMLNVTVEGGTQQTRFHLPDSLRAYAAERLRDATGKGEVGTRQRHATHFLAFAEKRMSRLRTSEEAPALAEIESVSDDLRAAEAWTRAAAPDLHFRLCLVLGSFMFRSGFLQTAADHFASGVAAAAAKEVVTDARISLLRTFAELQIRLGHFEAARTMLGEARELAGDGDTPEGRADAENLLGHVALSEHRFSEAREHFATALDLLEEAKASRVKTALILNNLGLTEWGDPAGDRDRGIEHLRKALELRRSAGDLRGQASTLNNLGNFAFAVNDWNGAAGYYLESFGLERALHHSFGVALTLNNYGEAVEKGGDTEFATRCFAASAHLFQESGSPLEEVASGNLARLGRDQADFTQVKGKNLEEVAAWATSS